MSKEPPQIHTPLADPPDIQIPRKRGYPEVPRPGYFVDNEGNKQECVCEELGPPIVIGGRTYRFNQEEMRVIRECNRESFWYRCVPIGGSFGALAYAAIKNGYLKPSLRFGAGPKMFIGVTIGYFIGKMSYHTECMKKIMALENSPLADSLRKQAKGKGGFTESFSSFQAPEVTPSYMPLESRGFDAESDDGRRFSEVSDTRPLDSFDTEASRTSATNLSGSSNDTTSQMLNDDNLPRGTSQMATSYDDLRRQNRDDYDKSRKSYGSPTYASQKPPEQPSAPVAERPKSKNIYGDVWEKAE